MAPLRSVPQAAQDLFILGIASIADEGPADRDCASAHLDGATQGRIPAAETAVAAVMTSSPHPLAAGQPGGSAPGSEVEEHFRPLRDLVAVTAGAPIDQVLKRINDLQQQMAKLAAAGPVTAAQTAAALGNEPVPRASGGSAASNPSRWRAGCRPSPNRAPHCAAVPVARGNRSLRPTTARSGPAALCPLAVNGRFPFVPGSSLDTPLEDFAKLFAPGGLIDGFFNTQLRPFVDTTGNPWKGQAVDGVPPPVSPADIAQFQRAAVIRDMFFAPGSTTIAVRFDITPVSLDAGASQVSLELDGTTVTYAQRPDHDRPRSPGPDRTACRMCASSSTRRRPAARACWPRAVRGRCFACSVAARSAQAGRAGRYTLSFALGNRRATFELRPATALNPFALGVLQDFRCPSVRD